jgi:hypothetical protein
VPVMIAHEAEMRRHRAETVPSRKRRRLDNEPGEAAGLLDVRVGRLGELCGVVSRVRRLADKMEVAVWGCSITGCLRSSGDQNVPVSIHGTLVGVGAGRTQQSLRYPPQGGCPWDYRRSRRARVRRFRAGTRPMSLRSHLPVKP